MSSTPKIGLHCVICPVRSTLFLTIPNTILWKEIYRYGISVSYTHLDVYKRQHLAYVLVLFSSPCLKSFSVKLSFNNYKNCLTHNIILSKQKTYYSNSLNSCPHGYDFTKSLNKLTVFYLNCIIVWHLAITYSIVYSALANQFITV